MSGSDSESQATHNPDHNAIPNSTNQEPRVIDDWNSQLSLQHEAGCE